MLHNVSQEPRERLVMGEFRYSGKLLLRPVSGCQFSNTLGGADEFGPTGLSKKACENLWQEFSGSGGIG